MKNEELWKQLEADQCRSTCRSFLPIRVIEGLRAKRSALQTEYQEKLETFQPSYPAMVQLSNQIAEIDRQIAAEVNTLKNSYKAAYDVSLEQETGMKKRIESSEARRARSAKTQHSSTTFSNARSIPTNRSITACCSATRKSTSPAASAPTTSSSSTRRRCRAGRRRRTCRARCMSLSYSGSAAALGVAFVLERLDDTLRSPEEIERALGLRHARHHPQDRPRAAALEAELADPRSHMSEAYRSLCTALQLSTEKGLPKTLLVTSAGPAKANRRPA